MFEGGENMYKVLSSFCQFRGKNVAIESGKGSLMAFP
jgi:hypothetical protein